MTDPHELIPEEQNERAVWCARLAEVAALPFEDRISRPLRILSDRLPALIKAAEERQEDFDHRVQDAIAAIESQTLHWKKRAERAERDALDLRRALRGTCEAVCDHDHPTDHTPFECGAAIREAYRRAERERDNVSGIERAAHRIAHEYLAVLRPGLPMSGHAADAASILGEVAEKAERDARVLHEIEAEACEVGGEQGVGYLYAAWVLAQIAEARAAEEEE